MLVSTDGGQTWTERLAGGVFNGRHVAQVAIDPTNAMRMYAATDGGLFESTDGGTTWSLPASPTYAAVAPAALNTNVTAVVVDPKNPANVYIGIGGGSTTLTADANAGAVSIRTSASIPVGSQIFIGSGATAERATTIAPVTGAGPYTIKLAAGLRNNHTSGELVNVVTTTPVAKSTDSGATWASASTGMAAPGIGTGTKTPLVALAIASSSPATLYASVGTDYRRVEVYKTTNAAGAWAKLAAAPDFTGAGYAYGGGNQEQGDYDNVVAVDPANPNHVFAGGIAVVESIDGGAHWFNVNGKDYLPVTAEANRFHPDEHALAFTPSGILWLGSDGGVYRLQGPRATYVPLSPGPNTNMASFTGTQILNVSPSAGTSFPASGELAVAPSAPAGTCGGTVVKPGLVSYGSVSKGPLFTEFKDVRNLSAAGCLQAGDVVVARITSGNQVTNANGNLNVTQFYFGFNEVGDVVLAGAQDNALARTTQGTVEPWSGINGGDGGPSQLTPNDATLEFATRNQALLRTTDSWAANTRVITPPGAVLPGGRIDSLFSPPLLVVANPANPANPTLFYGGKDLYRTTDPSAAAPTWNRVTAVGTFVSALAASPDGKTVYVGFTDGTVQVSTNGGETFRALLGKAFAAPYTFVAGLSVDPTNPRRVAASFSKTEATHTAYSTGRTREYQETPHAALYSWIGLPTLGLWTNITGDLPSVAVDRVVFDNGSLIAATDFGVYGTPVATPGTWTRVGTALPNVQVQDLFVDACTNDLYAVTHGRGAWKLAGTGGTGCVSVFFGYADSDHPKPGNFPAPWSGAAGVIFNGCLNACVFDAGAVRIVNNSAVAMTVNSVTVRYGTCTYDLWMHDRALPTGQQLIDTQTVSGPAKGCTGTNSSPRFVINDGHMDGSDIGPRGKDWTYKCVQSKIIPVVVLVATVNGTKSTSIFKDTGQVLNSGGKDCRGKNESRQWANAI